MARRAGFLFIALAVWASTMSTAGAQNQVICDGRVATIVGTPGDDVLEGTPGVDVIAGLQGDDFIDGLAGDDVICGGIGNDVILGGLGFDILFGAQGNDEIFAAAVTTMFVPGALDDERGARIFAGAGDDIVFGSDRWDRMQGGPGDDVLYGFAGNDWMRGGPGSDVVVGHAGKDDLHGGGGSDLVLAERNDSNVRAGAGQDFCPDLQGTTFRGCQVFLPVNANNSTLPAFDVPAELAGGAVDTYVYLGYIDGVGSYVGSTNDLTRVIDERFDTIREITVMPVTRGQARAIEQAILEVQTGFVNEVNSISPVHPYFAAAVEWGDAWLALNGFINEP